MSQSVAGAGAPLGRLARALLGHPTSRSNRSRIDARRSFATPGTASAQKKAAKTRQPRRRMFYAASARREIEDRSEGTGTGTGESGGEAALTEDGSQTTATSAEPSTAAQRSYRISDLGSNASGSGSSSSSEAGIKLTDNRVGPELSREQQQRGSNSETTTTTTTTTSNEDPKALSQGAAAAIAAAAASAPRNAFSPASSSSASSSSSTTTNAANTTKTENSRFGGHPYARRFEAEKNRERDRDRDRAAGNAQSQGQGQGQGQGRRSSAENAESFDRSRTVSNEELLKRRFWLAQGNRGDAGSSAGAGPSTLERETPQGEPTVIPSDGCMDSEQAQGGGNGGAGGGGGRGGGGGASSLENMPIGRVDGENGSGYSRPARIDHPFDTHRFVKRLEEAGLLRRGPRPSEMEGEAEEEGVNGEQGMMQIGKRHDPAEAIMEATRYLLVTRGEKVVDRHLNKGDLENEAYLFSAALSELRTELQVRARNDAAALRSITTLLQREVDGLSQKMREDINTLKHDIQVDMNNRKAESKEEQNNLEQEIQDLNNRFTISLSDLKTEIEQNIKWDATRRALALVFGIAAILIAALSAADYLTRDDESSRSSSSSNSHDNGSSSGRGARAGGDRGAGGLGRLGGLGGMGGMGQDHQGMDQMGEVPPPKSAEELGLIPRYETDGSRYV